MLEEAAQLFEEVTEAETPGPLEAEGVFSNSRADEPSADPAPEGTDPYLVPLRQPDDGRSVEAIRETSADEFAAQVASRLNDEIVAVLIERSQAVEAECSALRRIAAEAVIQNREAIQLAAAVPGDPFAGWLLDDEQPRCAGRPRY